MANNNGVATKLTVMFSDDDDDGDGFGLERSKPCSVNFRSSTACLIIIF